jgi:hypothetical protein
MDRQTAEEHWRYTEAIIHLMLELVHYLYVEAMLHGAKHQGEGDG